MAQRNSKGHFIGFGNEAGHWKGGEYICDGYRYIHSPDHPFATKDGYVVEHRLVMEKKIGRYLKKEENVHHKDENKLNNKIENLEIREHNEHFLFHNKAAVRTEKWKQNMSIGMKKYWKENKGKRKPTEKQLWGLKQRWKKNDTKFEC